MDLDERQARGIREGQHPRHEPWPALRVRRVRRHPLLQHPPRLRRVPPGRACPAPRGVGLGLPHGAAPLPRGLRRSGVRDHPRQPTEVLLHTAAGLPRLRRHGRQSAESRRSRRFPALHFA